MIEDLRAGVFAALLPQPRRTFAQPHPTEVVAGWRTPFTSAPGETRGRISGRSCVPSVCGYRGVNHGNSRRQSASAGPPRLGDATPPQPEQSLLGRSGPEAGRRIPSPSNGGVAGSGIPGKTGCPGITTPLRGRLFSRLHDTPHDEAASRTTGISARLTLSAMSTAFAGPFASRGFAPLTDVQGCRSLRSGRSEGIRRQGHGFPQPASVHACRPKPPVRRQAGCWKSIGRASQPDRFDQHRRASRRCREGVPRSGTETPFGRSWKRDASSRVRAVPPGMDSPRSPHRTPSFTGSSKAHAPHRQPRSARHPPPFFGRAESARNISA